MTLTQPSKPKLVRLGCGMEEFKRDHMGQYLSALSRGFCDAGPAFHERAVSSVACEGSKTICEASNADHVSHNQEEAPGMKAGQLAPNRRHEADVRELPVVTKDMADHGRTEVACPQQQERRKGPANSMRPKRNINVREHQSKAIQYQERKKQGDVDVCGPEEVGIGKLHDHRKERLLPTHGPPAFEKVMQMGPSKEKRRAPHHLLHAAASAEKQRARATAKHDLNTIVDCQHQRQERRQKTVIHDT